MTLSGSTDVPVATRDANAAVLRKQHDVAKAEGQAAVSLIESAGQITEQAAAVAAGPGVGTHIDLFA